MYFSQKIGCDQPDLLYPVLRQLAQLRSADSINLEAEIDAVVGKAVVAMGPRRLLEAIPFNIAGKKACQLFFNVSLLLFLDKEAYL